jgi:prolyl-tRNA synthetase
VLRSGQSDLEEPIAIRPTSETSMYPCKSSYIFLQQNSEFN